MKRSSWRGRKAQERFHSRRCRHVASWVHPKESKLYARELITSQAARPRSLRYLTHPILSAFHGARISSSCKIGAVCAHVQVCERRSGGEIGPGCDIRPGRVLFRRTARCPEHQRGAFFEMKSFNKLRDLSREIDRLINVRCLSFLSSRIANNTERIMRYSRYSRIKRIRITSVRSPTVRILALH